MAVVILDTTALVGDMMRAWPKDRELEVTPIELVSIAVATWIEYHNGHGRRELRDIMIVNLDDHFGTPNDDLWYQLTQSTYLMVDNYIGNAFNMANVDDVAYAGHVRDGIMVRLYGQGLVRG